MSDAPLPGGWRRSNLIGLAEYHNGAAFNPKQWGEDGLPIIRIEQINDPSAPTDFYNGPLIPQNRIGDGDLIFSWSATLKVAIWKHGAGALNQHLFKVVPRPGINKQFLFQVLDYHMDRIASGSHGSTMKHITRKELQRYRVPVPESELRQSSIAEILSTVDEAIEQTEALIAKQQQMKAGLMHDLFTRGVTPDGHLRPTRTEAPHLYQNSPLGWIPKEWEVCHFGAILNRCGGYRNGEGFLYLGRSYRLLLAADQEEPLLLKGGRFLLRRDLADQGSSEAAREAFRNYYIARGMQRIGARVCYFAPKAGVSPGKISVRDLGHRWASCSPNGNLAFHWKCMMAPPTVVDYIVVHELCHLHHLDHTDAFWNEVDKLIPCFLERKEWLRKNGASMEI